MIPGKVDPILGAKVKERLLLKDVETPMNGTGHNPQGAQGHLEYGVSKAMVALGLDLNDPSLIDTPRRFAEMLVNELTTGLDYKLFPKCTVTPAGNMQNMVLQRNLQVMSLCEHHLQTIDGYAHIAYIPCNNLLGLSKFARIVEFFSRRPQVQERLTAQIYEALCVVLDTEDVAVVITAQHYCMKARGVLQYKSDTTTDKMGGKFFTEHALRQELMHAIR